LVSLFQKARYFSVVVYITTQVFSYADEGPIKHINCPKLVGDFSKTTAQITYRSIPHLTQDIKHYIGLYCKTRNKVSLNQKNFQNLWLPAIQAAVAEKTNTPIFLWSYIESKWNYTHITQLKDQGIWQLRHFFTQYPESKELKNPNNPIASAYMVLNFFKAKFPIHILDICPVYAMYAFHLGNIPHKYCTKSPLPLLRWLAHRRKKRLEYIAQYEALKYLWANNTLLYDHSVYNTSVDANQSLQLTTQQDTPNVLLYWELNADLPISSISTMLQIPVHQLQDMNPWLFLTPKTLVPKNTYVYFYTNQPDMYENF
jgi:hypothetical protein